jgi:hypothetical protein
MEDTYGKCPRAGEGVEFIFSKGRNKWKIEQSQSIWLI